MTALHLPGFRVEEPAPATWNVAIEALSASVRLAAAGEPYVLVGYSSGGALAHAITERCEAEATEPTGLVIIDTYAPEDEPGAVFASMIGEILDRGNEYLEIDDGDLIAMGTFMRLSLEWRPGIVRVPTLLVRGSEPLGSAFDGQSRQPRWKLPATVVDVPGDHFTLIEGQAHATASAINAWLNEIVPPTSRAEPAGAAGVRALRTSASSQDG